MDGCVNEWSYADIIAGKGRICATTFGVLLEESVSDKFSEPFKEEVEEISEVGDGFSDEMSQGP